MENGEWGMGNGEWGMGNGERGMENGRLREQNHIILLTFFVELGSARMKSK
jgi:hypothetical protein